MLCLSYRSFSQTIRRCSDRVLNFAGSPLNRLSLYDSFLSIEAYCLLPSSPLLSLAAGLPVNCCIKIGFAGCLLRFKLFQEHLLPALQFRLRPGHRQDFGHLIQHPHPYLYLPHYGPIHLGLFAHRLFVGVMGPGDGLAAG